MTSSGDEVIVGMEGGSPRWVTINGVKVEGMVDMHFSIEGNMPLTRISFEMLGKVRVVPHNIENPEFAEFKKALKLT